MRFKRVLLKLSGEALMGYREFGVDPPTVFRIAKEIEEVHAMGIELAITIGGGNIIRGVAASKQGIERITADYMGMLATIINALAMQDALEKLDVPVRVQTAIEIKDVAEPFIRRRAMRHLEKGRIVIFAGGTGNPFFTTDSAAALRAKEIKAQALFKATKVDGIYTKDPALSKDARKLDFVSYGEMLAKNIRIIDATAVDLCRESQMPIIVFNLKIPGNIKKALLGENVGSVITSQEVVNGIYKEGKHAGSL